jgi:hypothetical protein
VCCRLRIKGGFAVVDRQQRRLHDRAQALGFPDVGSYLVARCQQDASLAQLAGELHTTIDVVRRLIDEAGIHRFSPKARSARQRRRATDRHLTQRAAQLGFADLGAYLADRLIRQAWTLTRVASELGIHRDTVSDRLDRYGLRPTRPTARQLMQMIRGLEPFGAGCVVVGAAGNGSHRELNPDFEIGVELPAAADGVVSVAALAQSPQGLVIAPFSNTFAQISGPGVNVLSAKNGSSVCQGED